MLSLAKKILPMIIVYALVGCVGIPTEQMHFYNCMITTGGDGGSFNEVPTKVVPQKKMFWVITHMSWDDTKKSAGMHKVKWRILQGESLVTERSDSYDLKETPNRMWSSYPAANFQVGHYHAEVIIDGKLVDTQEFDIVL